MPSLYGLRPGQKVDRDYQFRTKAYSSLKTDINFLGLPVYRAATKEEFALDALMLAGSFLTGGSVGGLRFASSKLESD